MLKLLVALILLAPSAAHAAEILYANHPLEAPASHAGLLVWSEGGDLRITRVGTHGQVLATHTVDLAETELSAPSVASDGEAYLVAFIHRSRHAGASVAVVPVDASGAPGIVRVYGSAQESKAPSLVRISGAYALWGERTLYMLDRDGLLLSESEALQRSAIVAAGSAILTFSTTTDPGGQRCTIGGRSCAYFPAVTTIDWNYATPVTQKSGSLFRPWSLRLGLAAAGNADGNEFVIAWIGESGPEAAVIRDGDASLLVKVPAFADLVSTPSIAFDGFRYLLVFQTIGNIFGAFIDVDGAIVQPFPIATSDLAEERPAVTALTRGRFLVTYKSGAALAGRVLITPDAAPARRRSVR